MQRNPSLAALCPCTPKVSPKVIPLVCKGKGQQGQGRTRTYKATLCRSDRSFAFGVGLDLYVPFYKLKPLSKRYGLQFVSESSDYFHCLCQKGIQFESNNPLFTSTNLRFIKGFDSL